MPREIKQTFLAAIAAIALLETPFCAAADVAGAVGHTIAAGTGVSDVISDLKQQADQLLDEAQNTGNVLTAQIGNQISVIAENMQIAVGDDINKTFGNVNGAEQSMLQEAENWRWQLIATKKEAYDLEGTANLDIDARLASLPFVQDKFFLQSVSNTAMLPDAQSYDMKVMASQIGIQEGRTSQVTLLDSTGNEIDDKAPDWTEAHTAILHIPGTTLSPLVSDSKLVLVPATLRFDIAEKKGISGFFGQVSHTVYNVPLKLSLYPRQAGTVTITGKVPSFAWVQIPPPSFPSGWTTDGNCPNHCGGDPIRTLQRNHLQFVAQSDENIRNATLHCDAAPNDPARPCSFAGVSFHDTDYQKGVKISGDEHTVVADWVSWTHPTHFTLQFELWQWQQQTPTAFPQVSVPIFWNRVTSFSIPTNRTQATVTVDSYTGQNYDLTVLGADPNHLVSMAQQSLNAGGMDTYAISVVQPKYAGQ
ncbi:hypothetical protein ACXIVK_00180 [Paraburkholderia caledonica]